MKEQQIDWVEELQEDSMNKRVSIFEVEDKYEDANLLVNALRTPDGTYLESRHQHDYKSHVDTENDTAYFVDGGLAYSRGNYKEKGAEDLRVYDTDGHIVIREYFSWKSYGKNGDKHPECILLKDMSDAHISAILKTQTHIPTYMFNMFVDELDYRYENDIVVEDNYG